MLYKILSWLSSGALGTIAKSLEQAHRDKLNAQTDKAKLEADIKISELEAQRAVILQAQSDRVERWVRVLFALGPVIYFNKIFIWDKVLGLGATDPLSPELNHVAMIILGGYFLVSTARIIRK